MSSDHNHDNAPAASLHASSETRYRAYIPAALALLLLLGGLAYQHLTTNPNDWVLLIIFSIAYIIVGGGVVLGALKGITRGEFFDEKFLMTIATLGAFFIGEYAEGVAVMLFYEVGELFQQAALNRAKRSIQALLDLRPEEAIILRDGVEEIVHPNTVQINDIIRVKPGQQVPLDGKVISPEATLNTAALTGESVPQNKKQGEQILAGMINLDRVIDFAVTARFTDTKLANVLKMVQDA
ncbi:MAG: heavy metal translocating P-type ATPase, partial [Pedobacter sp.]